MIQSPICSKDRNHSWQHTIAALENFEKTLLCNLCSSLLNAPLVIGRCQHIFCRSCAATHLGNSCPVCRLPCLAKEAREDHQIAALVNVCKRLKEVLKYDGASVLVNNAEMRKGLFENNESADAEHSTNQSNNKETEVECEQLAIPVNNIAEKTVESEDELPHLMDGNLSSKQSGKAKKKSNIKNKHTIPELFRNCKAKQEKNGPVEANSCEESKINMLSGEDCKTRKAKQTKYSDNAEEISKPRRKKLSSNKVGTLKIKRNLKGETSLHIAAIKNDFEMVKELLDSGADVNMKDYAGWTPLHEACIHGHSKVVAFLLDKGALCNVPGLDNMTPLHDAVNGNHVETVRLLIDKGANVHARNSKGITPLMMAKSAEMEAILKAASTTASVFRNPSSQVAHSSPEKIVILGSGLNDSQKKALNKCASLINASVESDFRDATHLVVACDESGLCQRTLKYLHGVLSGLWIVSYLWVTDCLEQKCKLPEESYEVSGTKQQPESYGANRGRLNALQQMPPLFNGCQFYFHGQFASPSPPREELISLVKRGGGRILAREPRTTHLDDTEKTVPYHADSDSPTSLASHFVVHQNPPKSKESGSPFVAHVTSSWLLNCIGLFRIIELPD